MIRLEGVSGIPAAKPPDFRRRALDLVAQGEPVARVARDPGISESFLRRWIEQNDVDSGCKEGMTSTERKDLVEMRRCSRVMEIEILKRATAYFARKDILPKQRSGRSRSWPSMGSPPR